MVILDEQQYTALGCLKLQTHFCGLLYLSTHSNMLQYGRLKIQTQFIQPNGLIGIAFHSSCTVEHFLTETIFPETNT